MAAWTAAIAGRQPGGRVLKFQRYADAVELIAQPISRGRMSRGRVRPREVCPVCGRPTP
jgi:hypothetical protein